MDTFVRPATVEDAGVLAALEQEARAGVAGVQRGGPQWLATHPELGAPGWEVRLSDPGWACVVGGIDEAVLGYGAMRVPLAGARRAAVIETIFVSPAAREVGVGEQVLDALLDRARAAGAEEVDATALPGDRETKNLFERCGLVARLIVVSRRLEP